MSSTRDEPGHGTGSAAPDAAGALAALIAGMPEPRFAEQLAPSAQKAIHGCTPLQVQLLHNRGVRGAEAIAAFFAADWRARGPELPGMVAAVARLRRAIEAGERITVFGDCDADGMTSCAVLLLALRALGADATPYIPRRDDDGRGLNAAAVRELAEGGTRLLVTTDCGTANVAECDLARALGVEVVITDHHPPHGAVAEASAVVNPCLADDPGDAADLAGVGVAFRVAEALLRALRPTDADALLEPLLDLVAVGTIADVVPLSTQNWALARSGLRRLNDAPRAGLRALLDQARLTPADVTERDISFVLAPRLNAAARLGEPMVALELLVTEDAAAAKTLAGTLDGLNQRRQQLLEALMQAARAQAQEQMEGLPAASPLIVAGAGWQLGIIGLVASRLADEFYRPVVAISQGEQECRGSGRGPAGSRLGDLLAARPELFLRFGGHDRAAGFTIATDKLDTLRAYLATHSVGRDGQTGDLDAPVPEAETARDHTFEVDCSLLFRHVNLDKYKAIRALAPYGPGFPEPIFSCRNVRLLACWRSGLEGRTLRLRLWDGTKEHVVFWQKRGEACDGLRAAIPRLPALEVFYTVGAYRPRPGSELLPTLRVEALRPTH